MVQELEPGDPEIVGRYRLVGRLGHGGMGRVFLGRSPGGRLVAVKLIRFELAGDPEFRVRFAREVAAARTVSGIFTVPVVDADVDGPQPWLVTAYVDGPSLADAVREGGPLEPGRLLPLAAGLAEGLEVIHAAGVVHRDLKPSNVLLAADGPRIIDFGISRVGDASGVTRTGLVTGSPGYMSPEQAEGGVAGPASDMFSLGSVLAFAATGHEPFGSGTAPAVLYRVVHGQPDTSGLPESVRSLVERCLAKDPARRPTAGQVVAEFGSAGPPGAWTPPAGAGTPYLPTATSLRAGDTIGLGERGPQPATLPAGPPAFGDNRTGRRPRGRGLVWGAVAVAVIAVAGGAVGMALSHQSTVRLAAQGSAPSTTVAPSRTDQAPASAPVSAPASASASRPAPPSAPATASATAGWKGYRDPTGFFIKLPPGWSVTSHSATEVRFTGPMPGVVILVAWTSQPQPDALADWRQQAAAKAQADPTYQQIAIQRVSYRGWNAADWEFTNMYGGVLTHVLDRGFIVTPGVLGYAIEIYGPDATFAAARASLWDGLVSTFEPAGTS